MTSLSREMTLVIVNEEGPAGLLRRLSDPVWFQAFGCVLGFDWHSSGVTTTVCGALKEGLRGLEADVGLTVAGGKGRASRRTPAEIEAACERTGTDAEPLVAASRLSAKVDSSAVQDGFQVYHHTFLFSGDGTWAVVQQGMDEGSGIARRYHWLTPPRFDSDPHAAVAGESGRRVLNLVAELAYGEAASVRDPVSFSFAHGGKDGTPYPVDRVGYDATIESLRRAVREAGAGRSEKLAALKRLAGLEAGSGVPPS